MKKQYFPPLPLSIGNMMRMKRNDDFYGEGVYISEKEACELLAFVKKVVKQVKRKLTK
ncbi:hypothetical protein KKA47_05010 [bacterium]|nr:hypothetical protein [bacterium]